MAQASPARPDGKECAARPKPRAARQQTARGPQPVRYLNELELVRGEVLANVWHSDRVARIDPATGALRGWIDFAGIRPDRSLSAPVP